MMRARGLSVLLVALCGLASAQAQTPAPPHLRIVSPGHSQTHVDLMVGDTARLSSRKGDSVLKVVWKSGNAAVASITTTGKLTAKTRGYATIKAIRGADTATIRACVTLVPAETLAAPALREHLIAAAPTHAKPLEGVGRFSFFAEDPHTHAVAIDSLAPIGTQQWGSCLHWFSATEGVTVDSVGRYTIPMRYDPTKPLPLQGFPLGASYLQFITPFAILGPQFLGAPIPFRKS
jgi:hypothetical protein